MFPASACIIDSGLMWSLRALPHNFPQRPLSFGGDQAKAMTTRADPPIRVCLVVSYFYPHQSGAERQALEQGRELVRQGHQVRVLTRRVGDLPRDEELFGLQVHRWVEPSTLGPFFGLSFAWGFARALKKLRGEIDLVHTHQGLWEAIAAGLARPGLRGIPTLIQPASSGYFGEAEELARTRGAGFLRRLILRNTAFAAISADIERQWRALGVPTDRIVRMASGVDTNRFHPGLSSLEESLPPRPRVVFTGRLHPQKNLSILLEAWPAVARQNGAHLLLVGDGEQADPLRQQAQALGVADSVHFIGAVEDPAEQLRASDVFVLPSVAEGMSNSLLEAMATALPCVVSAIGGNVDLIEAGRSGLLVSPDDPGSWSRALNELLQDSARARRFGEAARHRIESEFALPVVVGRYLELYRRLIRGESIVD